MNRTGRVYLYFLLVVSVQQAIIAVTITPAYKRMYCSMKPLCLAQQKGKRRHFTHPMNPVSFGTSTNWGGYAALTSVTSPQNKSVTKVAGSWVVPTLSSSSHSTYCATWVGIDGYASSTVEQIGTEQEWIDGRQVNYAWFEMYPRFAYQISGFPVSKGDSISASVTYKGDNVFTLSIANNTKKIYTVIPQSYTTMSGTQRNSAEWIVEPPYSGAILPLAKFSKITFTQCQATIKGISGSINNSHWTYDKINMVTDTGNPKALPSSLSNNGKTFSVTWKHE